MTTRNSEIATISPQHRGKLGLSYGWVSPTSRKRFAQSSCFQTFIKYFKQYCKHSSLVGLKYLAEDQATWFDRVVWIVAYVCTIFAMIFFSLVVYQEFIDTPITTTSEAELYPTEHLQFPGIAICSINRISLRMVKELATEIYNANISNLSLDETLEVLWTLGDFYETSNAKADNYTQLTQLLSKFYDNDYDIAELMMRLTPDCSAMLVLCYFQNEKQNCSDIFTVSQTETGFCCTFNYIPERYDSREATISFSPRRVEHVGKTSGLTLMLDPLMDDYFYPIISTVGWKVMVFDPYDYPDTTTGGVVELLLSPLNDKYVELDALGLHSSENIRSYPIEKRGCYFPNERPSISAIYTASDCIVACKIDDIWKSCKCRPFFYNPRPTERSNRTCTMEDIPCLREYKYKRLSIVPYPERTLHSLVNNNQTLYCKNCYPSCDDIFYLAKSTVFELSSGYFKTTLLDNVNVTNHSILRVYFGKIGTAYLKQDESYRWYEYLSDAGGICGFFVGFSLTSVIEIVYFSVLFLLELFNSKTDPETAGEDEHPHNQLSIQAVYWDELFPRSRIREQ